MAVHVHAGAENLDRIGEPAADAADVDLRNVIAVFDLQIHVGREVADLARVVDALRLERLAGYGDHGQRRVFQRLLSAAGRYDHLLEDRVRRCLSGSLLYRYQHRRAQRRRSPEKDCLQSFTFHFGFPSLQFSEAPRQAPWSLVSLET